MRLTRVLKRVWKFTTIVSFFFLFLLRATCMAEVILFQDNFEDGNASDWALGDGWGVVDDGGNFVLEGTTHATASAGENTWRNYSFKAKIKLRNSSSATIVNFRAVCERYGVAFTAGEVRLFKTQPCNTHPDIETVTETHDVDRWYTVEITGADSTIKVYVDDILKIDYTDSSPVLAGAIGFETTADFSVYFDDVVVTTDEPLAATKWTTTGGPLGGLGYDVRIHPGNDNIMYVTDNNAGVVKSNDAGENWSQANAGISIIGGTTGDIRPIFSLTIDPNNPDILWSGTNADGSAYGIFKSSDGGETWTMHTNGISLMGDVGLVFRGFTIQEGNSDVVYAQAEVPTEVQGKEFNRVKGRVYKTVDGGGTWNLIWQGDNLARYLIIDPGDANTLYLSTGIFDREANNSDCENSSYGGVGVLKSIDGGVSWSPINSGLTDLYVGTLRMDPTNPQILFAGAGNNACSNTSINGLFRTVNGGASWTKVIPGETITTVNFSPSSPSVLYAGSSNAFYRSADGGLGWTKYTKPAGYGYGPPGVLAGFPIDVTVAPTAPNTLYANNYGGGVFRSTDGAATWEEWSRGYSGAQIMALALSPKSSSMVYAIGRSGPFVSSDYGGEWTGLANGDASTNPEWYSIAVHPVIAAVVIVGSEFSGRLYRSSSCGDDFSEILQHPAIIPGDPTTRQGFKALAFAPSNPSVVYAGIAKPENQAADLSSTPPLGTIIWKSTNDGASFSPIPSTIDGKNVNALRVSPVDPNSVYAATGHGVYISSNGAVSWTYSATLGDRDIEAIDIDPQNPNYIIVGEVFGGIWISQDSGATWSGPHNNGFGSSNPFISAIAIDPSDPDKVYVGDLYSGVYRSDDKGNSWSPFPDWKMSGLTVRAVTDIALNGSAIHVGTQGGGVFKYALGPLAFSSYDCSPFPWTVFYPAFIK